MIFIVLFILISCKKEKEFIMGYYPSSESEKVIQDLRPLEEYLEKKLNIKIKPFIATDYTSLIEGLCSGKIDGSFLSALPYVISKNKCKTKMIITSLRRDGTTFYKTYFLANSSKNYKSLYDLKGKTWGIPDIASTSGYLFPVLRMNELGLNPDKDFKKIQLNTHENVIIAVYNNEVDFGTIYSDARITLKEEYPDVFEKTRVIDSIGPIPNDGFVVSSSLSEDLIKKLKEAFLSINSDTSILNRLRKYGWYGVVETNDSIYNLVEKLYFEILRSN